MKLQLLVSLLAFGWTTASETVLGVYIFSRHGDRTAKATPPANLTDLGYQEVFTSGTYYRDRYISSQATRRIYGINSDLVKQIQVAISAPEDIVLQNSAQGFTQGLYPPVGEQLGSAALRNGTIVQTPLNGYQLIPVNQVSSGTNSEDTAWLQGTTNCYNAQISSNDYFLSQQYLDTYNNSLPLYQSIYPDVNGTFTQSETNFKNAYVIWDLLNVASIHNSSASLPDSSDFFNLKVLADQHEFGLAYNQSQPIRAITGAVMCGEVLTALNSTLTSQGKTKLNVQFGAYNGMLSFFGLSNLTNVSPSFYGIPDYASSLVWELVTNESVSASSWPSTDDVAVRFYFHNGTTSNISQPTEFALFGTNQTPLPWNDFVTGMQKFSISGQQDWCTACGNTTGVCSSSSLNDDTGLSGKSNGLSKAVCGVIGAVVTLGVLLGLALLVLTIGGFTLVSRKRLRRSAEFQSNEPSLAKSAS